LKSREKSKPFKLKKCPTFERVKTRESNSTAGNGKKWVGQAQTHGSNIFFEIPAQSWNPATRTTKNVG
jgi:hypothetical protein